MIPCSSHPCASLIVFTCSPSAVPLRGDLVNAAPDPERLAGDQGIGEEGCSFSGQGSAIDSRQVLTSRSSL